MAEARASEKPRGASRFCFPAELDVSAYNGQRVGLPRRGLAVLTRLL